MRDNIDWHNESMFKLLFISLLLSLFLFLTLILFLLFFFSSFSYRFFSNEAVMQERLFKQEK